MIRHFPSRWSFLNTSSFRTNPSHFSQKMIDLVTLRDESFTVSEKEYNK